MLFSEYEDLEAKLPQDQELKLPKNLESNLSNNLRDVKEYLIKSIKEDNISHGYIFEGSKGIGKLSMAIFFAKSLLCKDFNNEPCDKCSSCIKINSMNHPDLHIISSDDRSIKREEIDVLISSVSQKPYESDRKIYIINNSEDMTMQAANTFLKTLEEPAGNTTMILLTENSNLLISTIVSRCQIIKFDKVNNEQIVNYIKNKFNLDDNTARLIAYYSKGVINNAEKIVTNQDNILKCREEIIKIFDRVLINGKSAIFEYETYFEENKDKIDEIAEILMIWLRDVSFKKHDIDELIINIDFLELLEKHAKLLDRQKIDELIRYLQNVNFDIKSNVNYKLIIDNMLILVSR